MNLSAASSRSIGLSGLISIVLASATVMPAGYLDF